MPEVRTEDVVSYVEANIGTFHQKRLQSLQRLKLKQILKRKNPYLFKAKNILTASDLVKTLLDAHLSSQEETIFGDFLEGLAIFINERVYGGQKSSSEGVDLEFSNDGVRYIVAIKSGPNWANSSQIRRMVDNFNKAKRILRTSNSNTLNVVAVNGCCYGKENQPDRGEYFKYCGQRFWEFISGDNNLYLDIIEPLGHQARQRNDEFILAYSQIINLFTQEFGENFCADGLIKWDELVKYNSSNGV